MRIVDLTVEQVGLFIAGVAAGALLLVLLFAVGLWLVDLARDIRRLW